MPEYDEGAGVRFRQVLAGGGNLFQSLLTDGHLVVEPFAAAVLELLAPREIAVAEMQQELADLLLEYDNHGYDSHSQHLPEYGRQQPHVQRLHHYPQYVQEQDTDEYRHGRGPPDEPEELIDEQSHEQYVEYVNECYVDKIYHGGLLITFKDTYYL